MVAQEREACSQATTASFFQARRPRPLPLDCDEGGEFWPEFWRHYRGEQSKIMSPRRTLKEGKVPPATSRIMREHKRFEEHAHSQSLLPLSARDAIKDSEDSSRFRGESSSGSKFAHACKEKIDSASVFLPSLGQTADESAISSKSPRAPLGLSRGRSYIRKVAHERTSKAAAQKVPKLNLPNIQAHHDRGHRSMSARHPNGSFVDFRKSLLFSEDSEEEDDTFVTKICSERKRPVMAELEQETLEEWRKECASQRTWLQPDLSEPSETFQRPWSREKKPKRGNTCSTCSLAELESNLNPVKRFAKVCRAAGVHPQPASARFLVHLPEKLDIREAGYADEDLLALVAALPYSGDIEEVDIRGNTRLTDASTTAMLKAFGERHGESLRVLRLDQCRRLSNSTTSLCAKLVDGPLQKLEILSMCGVSISVLQYSQLVQAIARHPTLKKLHLAETGLGFFDKTYTCSLVQSLISNPRLEALDLGWNSLDMQTFTVLGEGLASHTQLSQLGLANTGSTLDCVLNGSPLLVLLELLARNRSVTDLDIANNCLDAGGPLVLEAAARHHPCLQCINLSKNPISLDGVRCVMRLLATTEHLQLKKVLLEDCSGLREPGRVCYFDGDPSGPYSLNMARPANRAILRIMLLRFCEGSKKVSPSELIRGSMLRNNGIEKPFM